MEDGDALSNHGDPAGDGDDADDHSDDGGNDPGGGPDDDGLPDPAVVSDLLCRLTSAVPISCVAMVCPNVPDHYPRAAEHDGRLAIPDIAHDLHRPHVLQAVVDFEVAAMNITNKSVKPGFISI